MIDGNAGFLRHVAFGAGNFGVFSFQLKMRVLRVVKFEVFLPRLEPVTGRAILFTECNGLWISRGIPGEEMNVVLFVAAYAGRSGCRVARLIRPQDFSLRVFRPLFRVAFGALKLGMFADERITGFCVVESFRVKRVAVEISAFMVGVAGNTSFGGESVKAVLLVNLFANVLVAFQAHGIGYSLSRRVAFEAAGFFQILMTFN